MNYLAILKRSVQISWRYRALWLFGILLALFAGGSGGNVGSNASQAIQYRFGRSDLARLSSFDWGLIAAITLIVLALVLVLILVSLVIGSICQAALIGMVDEVERTGRTSITNGFRIGWTRFLYLIGISLVLGIPAIVVALALLVVPLLPLLLVALGAALEVPALQALGIALTVGLAILWILFVIVLAAALSLLKEFMFRRSVLGQRGVCQSIGEGYHLVRRNLRDAGVMWLLLLGINLLVGALLFPVVLAGVVLVAGPGLLVWLITRSLIAGVLAALPFLLIFVAVMAFLQGLHLVFQSAAWTLTYREIASRERR